MLDDVIMHDVNLFAVSDLHINYPENCTLAADLQSSSPDDWLIVAGDISDKIGDVAWLLGLLRKRFSQVFWTPGNHELWAKPEGGATISGEARYRHLVDICRSIGVTTPEDPYLTWHWRGEDIIIAPLFLLYDYTFNAEGVSSSKAVAQASASGVVCMDEFLLSPEPYPDRETWCAQRLRYTRARLDVLSNRKRTLLFSHWPLHVAPTRRLKYPEFAIWCGTRQTEDWHRKYRAAVVIYGHLHIPGTEWIDNVKLEEVSLGYPWERTQVCSSDTITLRQIFPSPSSESGGSL